MRKLIYSMTVSQLTARSCLPNSPNGLLSVRVSCLVTGTTTARRRTRPKKHLKSIVFCAALLASTLSLASPAAAAPPDELPLTSVVPASADLSAPPVAQALSLASLSSDMWLPAARSSAGPVAAAHRAKDATLRIVVRALPRSLSAKIVLAGPHHLHRRVARSISLRLPAGVYRLSAGPVTVAAGSYYATAPLERKRLQAGRVTTVTVSYATLVPKTTTVVPASGTVSLVGEPSGPRVLTLTGAAARDVKAGEILASGSTAAAPNGYLVKVTKVTHKSNGTAVLDVENTTLLQALPSGEIDAEDTLEAPAEAASLSRGGALDLTLGRAHAGSRSAHAAGFSLHATNLTCTTSAGVHVDAPTVSFTPSIAIHAHWGFFKLDSASFAATVAASLGMGANADAGAHCETKDPGIGLLPHPVSLPDVDVQVGPIPVVITPRLQVYLAGNASITAKVSVAIEQSASATVGVSYAHGRFSPIDSFPEHFKQSVTTEGDASAELALTPTVDTLIYGVGGPSFDIGAAAKFNAEIHKTPWWTLEGCLQAGLGFVISPLGLNWSDPHLIQLCKVLLSATNGPPAGAIEASSPPTNISPPSITDEQGNNPPQVGDTLHVTTGSWTGSPSEYSYEWQDCKPSGNCADNFFASRTSNYTITEHDRGATVRVLVAAYNDAGAAQPTPSAETAVIVGNGSGEGPHISRLGTIAAGSDHTCVLISGGSVDCWGLNEYGQLGDGTSSGPEHCTSFTYACSTKPVMVTGIADATAIAAGVSHTCALLADGSVDCWGSNDYGQLGNGTTESSLTPVGVTGITDATAITAGASYTCALLIDGSIKCWGSNADGDLGDGSTGESSTPVPVTGVADATAITAGWFHTCALLASGSIDCWGNNADGGLGDGSVGGSSTPVPVTGITNATAIAAGWFHTCALLAGGSIDCWGANEYGQLGDGTTENALTPMVVSGITDATAITAGSAHTCAVLTSGSVDCWGWNEYGQLGDGTNSGPGLCTAFAYPCSTTAVAVTGITDATAIAAGWRHTCALLSSGGVNCWGANYFGELGDGSTEEPYSSTPVVVSEIE